MDVYDDVMILQIENKNTGFRMIDLREGGGGELRAKPNVGGGVDKYLDAVDVCDDQFVDWLNVKWAR